MNWTVEISMNIQTLKLHHSWLPLYMKMDAFTALCGELCNIPCQFCLEFQKFLIQSGVTVGIPVKYYSSRQTCWCQLSHFNAYVTNLKHVHGSTAWLFNTDCSSLSIDGSKVGCSGHTLPPPFSPISVSCSSQQKIMGRRCLLLGWHPYLGNPGSSTAEIAEKSSSCLSDRCLTRQLHWWHRVV